MQNLTYHWDPCTAVSMVPTTVSGDDCLPVCLELDDDRWDEHFMANIAGAQEYNNEDEKVTEKTKQPFHNLKVIKKLLHHLNKYNTFWNAME